MHDVTASTGALLIACALALIAAASCTAGGGQPVAIVPPAAATVLDVRAPTLTTGAFIRPRYTCDGLDISPEVSWGTPPAGTRSFVLLMDDPDAPGGAFTHWLAYDLPPDVRGLEEAVGGAVNEAASGGRQGLTGFNTMGYAGPCPPGAQTHTYVLHVYALDITLGLPGRSTRASVFARMSPEHILAHGQVTGRYSRGLVAGTPAP